MRNDNKKNSSYYDIFLSFIQKVLYKEYSRKSLITIIDQVIVSATNFLTGVIIGRTLEKEQFGYYLLGLTIVFVAINLQDSLISWPYTVYLKTYNKADQSLYKSSTIIHSLVLSLIIATFLILLTLLSTIYTGPSGLDLLLWALVMSITFIMFREFLRKLFFASMNMESALALDSFVSVFQIGGLIILSYSKSLSVSRSFWVIGAACGVVSIFWLIMNRKSFIFSLETARLNFKRNFSFGKWIFIGSTISIISVQIYPWVLTSFHGAAATGILAAYLGIVGLSNPFAYAVGNFLLPSTTDIYYTYGIKGLRQSVQKAMIFIGVIMISFCLLIFIFGNMLVIIIYGNKYATNIAVLLLLALSASVIVISNPLSAALYALDKPKILYRIDIASFLLFSIIAFLLIIRFGLLGVGIGSLGRNLGVSFLRYFYYIKHVNSITDFHVPQINSILR